MNIFITNKCPVKSAQFLDDKRVIKMTLESAQILSTSINESGGSGPYKSYHPNMSVVKWARESCGNYLWLLRHFEALLEEYRKRQSKVHACLGLLPLLRDGRDWIQNGTMTQFVNYAKNKSLELDFTDYKDTHKAYQDYLKTRWNMDKRKPTWYGKPDLTKE